MAFEAGASKITLWCGSKLSHTKPPPSTTHFVCNIGRGGCQYGKLIRLDVCYKSHKAAVWTEKSPLSSHFCQTPVCWSSFLGAPDSSLTSTKTHLCLYHNLYIITIHPVSVCHFFISTQGQGVGANSSCHGVKTGTSCQFVTGLEACFQEMLWENI